MPMRKKKKKTLHRLESDLNSQLSVLSSLLPLLFPLLGLADVDKSQMHVRAKRAWDRGTKKIYLKTEMAQHEW